MIGQFAPRRFMLPMLQQIDDFDVLPDRAHDCVLILDSQDSNPVIMAVDAHNGVPSQPLPGHIKEQLVKLIIAMHKVSPSMLLVTVLLLLDQLAQLGKMLRTAFRQKQIDDREFQAFTDKTLLFDPIEVDAGNHGLPLRDNVNQPFAL